MAFVSLTKITLNNIFNVQAFWYHTLNSYRACKASNGVMKIKLSVARIDYFTMTLWENKQSMQKFIKHPKHIRAMQWSKGRSYGKTYHYENTTLPSWDEAKNLLEKVGKAF